MASVQKLMYMSCYGITRNEMALSLGMKNETKNDLKWCRQTKFSVLNPLLLLCGLRGGKNGSGDVNLKK